MPYYPESKYSKPKSAGLGEFVDQKTQKEYRGFFVKTFDNKYFAGKSPMETGIELQKVKHHQLGLDEGIPVLFGILAGSLGGFFKKKPTKSEKENGVAKRYFVQDMNNNKIVETDKVSYMQTKNNVPNRIFAEVDWIIKGPADDRIVNGYPFEGAESKNKKTILALENTMPGISTFITDYKHLVEEPVIAQKQEPVTYTVTVEDQNTQLDQSRKARFDKRSDIVFPSASIFAKPTTTVTVPTIITDGLILHLDAGNMASYPGAGTIWTDLSGNGNNGTLINGPTFDSANGGSVVFDGVNDQVTLAGVTVSTTSTINIWVYPIPSSGNYGTLLTQGASYGIWYRGGTQKVSSYYTTDHLTTQTLTENQWNNLAIVNNGGNLSFYINNILDSSTYTSAVSFTANTIGNDPTSEIFKGKISNIQVYNRVLTPAEITYNYNTIKTRY